MIYGYGLKQVNNYGLLEMKEVTFVTSPQVLREVARFLVAAAQEMEAGKLSESWHRHIGNVVQDWDARFPGKDIIVAVPAGASDIEAQIVV